MLVNFKEFLEQKVHPMLWEDFAKELEKRPDLKGINILKDLSVYDEYLLQKAYNKVYCESKHWYEISLQKLEQLNIRTDIEALNLFSHKLIYIYGEGSYQCLLLIMNMAKQLHLPIQCKIITHKKYKIVV